MRAGGQQERSFGRAVRRGRPLAVGSEPGRSLLDADGLRGGRGKKGGGFVAAQGNCGHPSKIESFHRGSLRKPLVNAAGRNMTC